MNATANVDIDQSRKTLTTEIYALYAASFFVGITAFVAIIMNHTKREETAGTFLESHFRWQTRTFWIGMLRIVIGAASFLVDIGWLILIANCEWVMYRIAKGWLRLNDNLPMYVR